jgi:phosphonate degradation associated HDIG domain protein
MTLTIAEITSLLQQRGTAQYGTEAVNQLEHALQCANLAQHAGETSHTIVASLLHDLGHLLVAERDGTVEHDISKDDLHQYIALPFLRGLFPEAVLQPIRLHVDAKRYLCLAEAGYWEALSPASKRSLEQQGGVYTDEQARTFLEQAWASEAIRVRRYDDLAKVAGATVPELDSYRALLEQACH